MVDGNGNSQSILQWLVFPPLCGVMNLRTQFLTLSASQFDLRYVFIWYKLHRCTYVQQFFSIYEPELAAKSVVNTGQMMFFKVCQRNFIEKMVLAQGAL